MSLDGSLLFWKWADRDLEPGAVLDQVDDLCRRSSFRYVGVGLEHTKSSFDSDRAHDAVAAAARRLREHSRELVLSIDPRQEPDWHGAHPDHCLGWVDTVHTDADVGGGSVAWESKPGLFHDHFGVHAVVRSELLAAFAYDPAEPSRTPTRIDEQVAAEVVEAGHVEVAVPTLDGGRRALVLVVHWLDYPHVFGQHVLDRHAQLLDRYHDVPLAGFAVDEWGTVPQPGFVFDRAWATPWWSPGFAEHYGAATGGDPLVGLFRQQVGDDTDPSVQTRAIVDAFRVLHDRTAAFEDHHYRATKERLGPDAYVGFHSTWWAVDEGNQSKELFKNGFNWWATRRDLGQTDEVAPMGVRLALARKAGRPAFWNMWYSMGTHALETYAQDAWRNARYGGRTNHLGYRCEAEKWAVMELADGGLEEVSAMEDVIRRMAPLVTAHVDSRVLVVFGWEAAVDWRRHVAAGTGAWDWSGDTVTRAYRALRALWDDGFVAEIVPDHEALSVDGDGRVVWCGKAFDAAVFVDCDPPPGATAAVVTEGDVVAAVDAVGATRNDVPWGCRLEDGTVLIAAPGESLDPIVSANHVDGVPPEIVRCPTTLRPTGNPIDVQLTVAGRTVRVEATDFVVIAADLSRITAGELHRVTVDGDDATSRYR